MFSGQSALCTRFLRLVSAPLHVTSEVSSLRFLNQISSVNFSIIIILKKLHVEV